MVLVSLSAVGRSIRGEIDVEIIVDERGRIVAKENREFLQAHERMTGAMTFVIQSDDAPLWLRIWAPVVEKFPIHEFH